jgi:succinylarginine dihydrolase
MPRKNGHRYHCGNSDVVKEGAVRTSGTHADGFVITGSNTWITNAGTITTGADPADGIAPISNGR